MARRGLPEINAGSMADIAFLLLIFFLVTTTMDTPTGLLRQLPPKLDNQDPPPPVKKRNIFEVLVNANNDLLVEGEPMEVEDLREAAKEFIIGRPNEPQNTDFPEFKPWKEEIPFYGKDYMVSKQIVSLQNHKGTHYGMYLRVQNELVAAYNELREAECQKKFGMSYARLVELKKDGNEEAKLKYKAIKAVLPQRISEAEPNNAAAAQAGPEAGG